MPFSLSGITKNRRIIILRPIRTLFLVAALTFCGCASTKIRAQSPETTPFSWQHGSPEEAGFDAAQIAALTEVLFTHETRKLLVIRDDKIIVERFATGWEDSEKPHYAASLSKAVVSGMALAAAMSDGYIHPDAPAARYIPAWAGSNLKSKITIRHLATHTSGLEDAEATVAEENYLASDSSLDHHKDLPGWKGQFWRHDPDPFSVSRDSAEVLFVPGTNVGYSNPGIAMLNYAVTASLKNAPQRDIRSYLQQRIYAPLGIEAGTYALGYRQTYTVDSLPLVGGWGGSNFTADAVARLGRLMLRNGNWQGRQLLDSAVVAQVTRYGGVGVPPDAMPDKDHPNWSARSADDPIPAGTLGWYTNFDGVWPSLPRDAFCGAGAGHQLLLVVPSLNLIVVRMGQSLSGQEPSESFWGALETYVFNPLMDARTEAPYPPSESIVGVDFAPPAEVVRLAPGSDIWATTWADDDLLYTAYGDGWGFEPRTELKMSLGLACISGQPPGLQGENLRSASGERVGQGKFGPKASGMLMVDGVLYMLVRNVDNAQLARSTDRGKTWQWADWKFGDSFGCPNFVNYGKNYAGAVDEYVYLYSADAPSAYEQADQMVMARVPKDRLMDWRHYRYFAGYGTNGQPVWSEDVRKREPVFVNPGNCYRSSLSYARGLGRYLWCQIIPLSGREEKQGPRFRGGLGIFEAPNPWGPWRTVDHDRNWDMGPGESGSLPTKWMSDDGGTAHFLFSGQDAFSVRKLAFRRKN